MYTEHLATIRLNILQRITILLNLKNGVVQFDHKIVSQASIQILIGFIYNRSLIKVKKKGFIYLNFILNSKTNYKLQDKKVYKGSKHGDLNINRIGSSKPCESLILGLFFYYNNRRYFLDLFPLLTALRIL